MLCYLALKSLHSKHTRATVTVYQWTRRHNWNIWMFRTTEIQSRPRQDTQPRSFL